MEDVRVKITCLICVTLIVCFYILNFVTIKIDCTFNHKLIQDYYTPLRIEIKGH